MTNRQIIFSEQLSLMERGLIRSTGRAVTVKDTSGNRMVIKEPEPIHTIEGWRSLGYSVRKGEAPVASFMIWKYGEKVNKITRKKEKRLFQKKANFYAASQVRRIR